MREYEPIGYCPTCGARDGELCFTPSGRLASNAHAARTRRVASRDTRQRQRRHVVPPRARTAIIRRSGGWCEACPVLDPRAPRHPGEHPHHKRRRSQGGSDDPTNLVWTCARGHALIHDHVRLAYSLGLLVRTSATVPD